jgi:hypothetical protein
VARKADLSKHRRENREQVLEMMQMLKELTVLQAEMSAEVLALLKQGGRLGTLVPPVLECAKAALLTVLVLGENLAKAEVAEINEALTDAGLPYRLTTRLQ